MPARRSKSTSVKCFQLRLSLRREIHRRSPCRRTDVAPVRLTATHSLFPQRAGDLSEGHALVYRICTESGQPVDAQQQCYELFIDYVRAVTEKYGNTVEHDAIITGLKKVRYRPSWATV